MVTVQARTEKMFWLLAQSIVPDLILMDIQLSEVSGLDVTKWLKKTMI